MLCLCKLNQSKGGVKMAFYKMQQGQNEFLFQLADLQVREDFAVWDNTQKRFLRQIDGVVNMDDLKYMNKELFQQRYPNMRKVTQYLRDIVVTIDGTLTQYGFGFKKSANDQIVEEIRIRQSLGKDPLAYTYKYRKTGTGLATNHVVVVMQEVGKPQGVYNPYLQQQGFTPIPQQKPQEQPKMGLVVSSVVLTPQEQQILDLFNQDTQIYGEDLFIEIFNKTLSKYFNLMLMSDKIKRIYRECYQKQIPK